MNDVPRLPQPDIARITVPSQVGGKQPVARGWVVPTVGGVLQGIVLILIGAYYDHIGRTPGPMVWLGASLLAGPWFAYARWQWRRDQAWMTERRRARLAETRAAVVLRPIAQRHRGQITGVFERIDAELDEASMIEGEVDDDDGG